MNRRHGMSVLAASLMAGPRLAPAQPAQPATPQRIGVLSYGSPPGGVNPDPAIGLREGLQALGWAEGRNLIVERRFADGRPERLAALAADLLRLKVALIVAGGPASIEAARAATATIAIVAIGGIDPVGHGWAQSLGRPGGNLTGVTVGFPEMGAKRLEILKEARPALARVAVLRAPAETPKGDLGLRAGAQALGLDLLLLDVSEASDIEPAFERAGQARADGLYAIPTNLIVTQRHLVAELARRHRLPSISEFPLMAQAGLMLSYGADLDALGRRAANHIDKILKGARPGDLPIEMPSQFELVINLQTARAIGITLPPATLRRADRVIE